MCGKAAAVWNVPRTLYGVGAVVSAKALLAWHRVPLHVIETAQQAVAEKRRPSLDVMLHVGWQLAWAFNDQRGYADQTLHQLSTNSKGHYGTDACAAARFAFDQARIWVTVKPGAPGSGSWSVLSTYDPRGFLTNNATGLPHADCVQSQWDTATIAVGYSPENNQTQRDYPTALSSSTKTTTAADSAAVLSTSDQRPWDVPRVDDSDPRLLQVVRALKADPQGHRDAHLVKYAKDVVTLFPALTQKQHVDIVRTSADAEPPDVDRKRRYDALCTAATTLQIHLPTGDTQ